MPKVSVLVTGSAQPMAGVDALEGQIVQILASGDGEADDTASIQTAIEVAEAVNAGELYFTGTSDD